MWQASCLGQAQGPLDVAAVAVAVPERLGAWAAKCFAQSDPDRGIFLHIGTRSVSSGRGPPRRGCRPVQARSVFLEGVAQP